MLTFFFINTFYLSPLKLKNLKVRINTHCRSCCYKISVHDIVSVCIQSEDINTLFTLLAHPWELILYPYRIVCRL